MQTRILNPVLSTVHIREMSKWLLPYVQVLMSLIGFQFQYSMRSGTRLVPKSYPTYYCALIRVNPLDAIAKQVKDVNKEVKTQSIFYFLLPQSECLDGHPLTADSQGIGVSWKVWSWVFV